MRIAHLASDIVTTSTQFSLSLYMHIWGGIVTDGWSVEYAFKSADMPQSKLVRSPTVGHGWAGRRIAELASDIVVLYMHGW